MRAKVRTQKENGMYKIVVIIPVKKTIIINNKKVHTTITEYPTERSYRTKKEAVQAMRDMYDNPPLNGYWFWRESDHTILL